MIVLDIGTSTDKFQLATCYSPPNEKLPISLFDEVLKRNTNTILLGDLNAKHKAWSNTSENHKGRLLFNWLSTNTLEIINKFVATSTRSNATIDVIVAPTHMLATSASISVLPSVGDDHLPVTLTPAIKIPKSDLHYPVVRRYWLLVELFLVFTYTFWKKMFTNPDDYTSVFSTYERFLSLLVARVTLVHYCDAYKSSLPNHIVNAIQQKKMVLRLARKTRHSLFITQLKVYSAIVRKEIFAHKRSSWRKYCGTLNTGLAKRFCGKARRHFSVTTPAIHGFVLSNKSVVSLPNEMCSLARTFYENQFSNHIETFIPLEVEAQNIVKLLKNEITTIKPLAPDLTTKDITQVIVSLKNKSSSGADGVSNKTIKLIPRSHHSFICSCFNYFMLHLCMPPR